MMLALMLALTPYKGPAVTAVRAPHATFSVAVRGGWDQTVRLRAIGVPSGYIASFCTNRVCAPLSVVIRLPRSGRAAIELAFIKNTADATEPKFVTVAANGVQQVRIAYSDGVARTNRR